MHGHQRFKHFIFKLIEMASRQFFFCTSKSNKKSQDKKVSVSVKVAEAEEDVKIIPYIRT
jgi:hypothetical protein